MDNALILDSLLILYTHDDWTGRRSAKQIEAETKWPLYRRRHFHMPFLEWKYINFD